MISIEIRMSPPVCESSGDGFSVQFTNSAFRSEKSQRLVVHSSSWKSVKVMRPSRSMSRLPSHGQSGVASATRSPDC